MPLYSRVSSNICPVIVLTRRKQEAEDAQEAKNKIDRDIAINAGLADGPKETPQVEYVPIKAFKAFPKKTRLLRSRDSPVKKSPTKTPTKEDGGAGGGSAKKRGRDGDHAGGSGSGSGKKPKR